MAQPFVARSLTVVVVASLVALAATSFAAPAAKPVSPASTPAVVDSKPWTGDFDGMFERRRIRMLAPYSKSLFFMEGGRPRGLTAQLAKDFENYLNQKHAKELGGKRITVSLVPTTRDKLLSALVDGGGDISGGNLTATASRAKIADFVSPTERAPAQELLVSSANAPAIATLEDLSGKRVNVRQASSYHESLMALNEKLNAASKPGVQVVLMSDALEDEDVLEMLNAGLIEYTVVDSWKAKLWAEMLPKIKVREDIVLRSGGTIGWAIRKQSPKLQAELDGFYKNASQQGLIEARLANYHEILGELAKRGAGQASRFDQTVAMLQKYGAQHAFDPLMLVAEGFQEGSTKAAATAAAPPATPEEIEKGVQAATKYIDQLMAGSFADARFSDLDRTLFTFASYKVGADKIASMRQEATKRGLDPNQWFNNVELVSAQKLGMETTAYVRNILKYNVASQLVAAAPAAPKN